MQLFQSLWIKLQNPNFNKLDPKDQEEIFTNLTETSLTNIIDMMVEAVENNNYDGNVDKTVNELYDLYSNYQVDGWNYDWTSTKALLFTVTIMTTVGYGHISPSTDAGKVIIQYLFLSNIT